MGEGRYLQFPTGAVSVQTSYSRFSPPSVLRPRSSALRRRGLLTIEDLARKLRRTYQTVRKALAQTEPPVPHLLAIDGKTKLYRRKDAADWLRKRWGFTGR